MSNNKLINKSNKDFLSKFPINFAQFSAFANRESIKNRALGNNTKLRDSYNSEIKETFDKSLTVKEYKKKNRYKVQAVIQDIMSHNEKKHRVCLCNRAKISPNDKVSVTYNYNQESASFKNLIQCGDGWVCPVCSERKANEKREKVNEDLILLEKNNYFAHMITFTAPHFVSDSLKNTLEKLLKAKSLFYKESFKDFEDAGHITTTEVKWSAKNGWHPHFHIILFTDKRYSEEKLNGKLVKDEQDSSIKELNLKSYEYHDYSDSIKEKMWQKWKKCCLKAGLREPSLKNGIDIKRGYNDFDEKRSHTTQLVDYVLKDQLSNEVTMSHTKTKSRIDSLTPFDLAVSAERDTKNSIFAKLFREYAVAIKGKNNAKYSRKLSALVKKLRKLEAEKEDEKGQEQEEQDRIEQVYELENNEFYALNQNCEYKGTFLILIQRDIQKHLEKNDDLMFCKYNYADSFINLITSLHPPPPS